LPQNTETVFSSSSPAPAPTASRLEKFSVSGTVVDAVTGNPIRKALVELNGMQQRRTAFTDGDGRFQFEGVAAGTVAFMVQKPGYFGELETRGQATQIQIGPKTDPIVLKLTPESVISGRVTNVSGVPLEHVPLSLTYLNVREGRRRWEPKGQANSDDNGRFRFANLLPGAYYISAGPYTPRLEALFDIEQRPKTGYPVAYYSGSPDLASASPIRLAAGQQAEANFALSEVPAYDVSGVVGGYGPGQGVGIQLINQLGSPLAVEVQFSQDNGRFDVRGLPAGTYVLKAFSQSAPNQPVRAETRLNVASNIFNFNLALGPAISIPVSVHQESRTPAVDTIPANSGGLNATPPPLSVRLLGNEPGMADSYSTLEGPPAAQKVVLRNVEPGKYTVDLMPQNSWYVQSAEYGQTNLLGDDLALMAGGSALPIEVVLRNDGASLEATVSPRDDHNLPATVVAIREGSPKAAPRIANCIPPGEASAENAGVTIDSLPPGQYLVLAFDHAENLEYSNPDVLQEYLSQAVRVTLIAGQTTKIKLDLISTEEISH
jgi:hypothetical protein